MEKKTESPLRVLIAEDSDDDAVLVANELRRCGMPAVLRRVQSAAEFGAALATERWDLVLSDYSMPSFEARHALALWKKSGVDAPFLVVSGRIGEEAAVALLKEGAHDFVSKDRIGLLGPAVTRALRDAALRDEQKKMRHHLVLSDRMASIGALAGGIAHEVNNPLAATLANLEYTQEQVRKVLESRHAGSESEHETNQGILNALGDARAAAERVREIVADLKLLSDPGQEHKRPVDLHRVIDSAARIAHGDLSRSACLVRDYGEIPFVTADEVRLSHVFLNILVNAVQSLPPDPPREHEIRIVTRALPDHRVLVEVHDTGSGMSEEVLSQAFEAFYTTKPMGVGTGLGLAICRRIVSSFGGEISAESRVGDGTVVRVYLPTPRDDDDPSAPDPAPPAHRGRVLVVDDDASTCASMARMLESEHEVTTLAEPAEALHWLDTATDVDVVFCSMRTKTMDGARFHATLTERSPELARRVVFLVDGIASPATRAFLERSGCSSMLKPPFAQVLRDIVRLLTTPK